MYGFTLVELLVVVSIIALLLSILLPALGKAKHSALSVVCASRERAIGQSYFNYAMDYSDQIVPIIDVTIGSSPKRTSWVWQLMGYGLEEYMDEERLVSGYNETHIQCPVNRTSNSSYAQNSYIGYTSWWLNYADGAQTFPRTFTEVWNSSCTGLTVESSHRHYYLNYGAIELGRENDSEAPLPHWGTYLGDTNSGVGIWVNGNANVLWCDGHVSSVKNGDSSLRPENFDPDIYE